MNHTEKHDEVSDGTQTIDIENAVHADKLFCQNF